MLPEESDVKCPMCDRPLIVVARDPIRVPVSHNRAIVGKLGKKTRKTLDILRCRSCVKLKEGRRWGCVASGFNLPGIIEFPCERRRAMRERGHRQEDNPGFENAVKAIESLCEGDTT